MSHKNVPHRPLPWLLGGSLGFTGAGVIAGGTTVPSSGKVGQLFLHNPTGRKVLLQYDGTVWRPIFAYGDTLVFVNSASGSDTQNKGFGTGADAYASITYALSQLAPHLGGHATISISNHTYSAALVIQGYMAVGGIYVLTLQGTLVNYQSNITASGTSVAGGGSTQGTVVRASGTWTVDEIRDKRIRFTAGTATVALRSVERIVDSNTTTTASIVGYWPAAPTGSDTFDVLDYGTQVAPASGTALTITNGPGMQVSIEDLFFNPANDTSGFGIGNWSNVQFTRCRFSNGGSVGVNSVAFAGTYGVGGGCLFDYDLGSAFADRILYANRSELRLFFCKVTAAPYAGSVDFGYVYGCAIDNGSFLHVDLGTVIEGIQSAGTVFVASNGCYVQNNSTALFGDTVTSDPRIRGWDNGIRAETSSPVTTYNVTYTGNTTDENADAATFGSIL